MKSVTEPYEEYSLDQLIETFSKHAMEYYENETRFPVDFNLPHALASICSELITLKDKYESTKT